ncbi:hypothetical protein [Spongiibacter marinus]|uniref:hypothetical protein n=1 Tax=Spongiibacter marinus TaxID=354246 RepID=UPI00196046CC|nr:hypothetical protein [Spongiibacter marinus]MBM7425061.1 hypothetical protein [Spongiibacter marinus]
MANFRNTIAKRDQRLVARLGRPLQWVKTGGGTVDGFGLLDLQAEFFSDQDGAPYIGKVVVVPVGFIDKFKRGEKVIDMETGKEYVLEETLKDDGSMRSIQVTS